MSRPTSTASPEHAYFQAIEECFIRLRGAPLLLSPSDWQVARGWHDRGIPVEFVCRAIESFFSARADRGQTGKVRSLKYCAAAVEESWAERQAVLAPASRRQADAIDVADRLGRLAEACERALPSSPIATRLRGLEGGVAEVEERLEALDRELVASARSLLTAEARQELDAAVDKSAARLAGVLSEGELARARERLFWQVLRRELSLPLLSLFSPDARD